MTSLRRTLLVTLLGGILLVTALSGYATYRAARGEIDQLMDYQLRQLALSLRDQHLASGFVEPLAAPDETLDVVIQIWDMQGVRLYLSHPHSALPTLAQFGYSTTDSREGFWRVYALPMPDHVIQVAQRLSVRSRLAANAALQTALPTVAAVPLLGVLIWLLVTRGLRPLQSLTRDIHARRPDALEPLDPRAAPAEVAPLVDALNALLARLDRALTAQREFIADAAHELRTPLAALQIQLQLAEQADSAAAREDAFADFRAGLTRTLHLVQQLLTLARLEPGADDPAGASATSGLAVPSPVALAPLVRDALVAHAPLAQSRGINLGAGALDDAARVAAPAADVGVLLTNLVSNAVKYAADRGRVDVSATRAPGGDGRAAVVLCVDDDGPGIPEAERQRVFDRFYRRAADTATPGSGLGLAIVQRVATRAGATVSLDASPLGGLRVRVAFPAA